VTFLLSQTRFNAEVRSFILLMLSVGLTMLIKDESCTPILVACLSGMLFWKLLENLLHKPESRLDDVLAPSVWLTAFYWCHTGLSDTSAKFCLGAVLCTLLTSVFIRWIQVVLLHEDKVYLKRIVLSVAGGLTFLILLTKVLSNDKLSSLALLCGGGYLVTYFLQSLDRNVDEGPALARSVKNILLVGIATIVATRLFGMEGLLVLAAATVIAPQPGSALIAGFFWVSRVLLQIYVLVNNPNVTGVNLMHYYTSAAMYAGFLMVLLAMLLIRDLGNRKVLAALLIGAAVIIPAASNFLMHPEPTGSFLISLGVTAVLAAMMAPAMFPMKSTDQENLVLLPSLATCVALMTQQLIELGNNADSHQRMVAMLWA
ncbi:MAG: hypothetical protein ACRD3W_21380, partial [Terriglobales bacterium]